MSEPTQLVQFIGINPNELVEQLKSSILAELGKNQKNNDELDLLTRNEVCKLLRINLSTLYRWQKGKTIPSYGMGNRVYFKKSEIEKLLNKNKLS